MAVLDQSYRRWSGTPTGYLRRVLVIPRFDFLDVVSKRGWLLAWIACLVPPLILGGLVYLATNIDALRSMIPLLPAGLEVPPPGEDLYQAFLAIQCWMLAAFAVLVGPPLATRDFANGAIPLYLSKSLRRWDFVAGRCAVLAVLLSLASWIPYMAVFLVECGLTTPQWRSEHWGLAGSILVSTLPIVALLTLLIVAVGALVQRTNLSRAAMLFLILATWPLSTFVETSIDSPRARIISPTEVTGRLRDWAFEQHQDEALRGAVRAPAPPAPRVDELSAGLALAALVAWISACVAILARKVRPVEVVK